MVSAGHFGLPSTWCSAFRVTSISRLRLPSDAPPIPDAALVAGWHSCSKLCRLRALRPEHFLVQCDRPQEQRLSPLFGVAEFVDCTRIVKGSQRSRMDPAHLRLTDFASQSCNPVIWIANRAKEVCRLARWRIHNDHDPYCSKPCRREARAN